MEVIVKGSSLINKTNIETGRFTSEYITNKISPKLLSGFKLLGVEKLLFKQQAVVPYNAKTLINWYNKEKIDEQEISKYLMFPIGSTTSKGNRIKETLLLENKTKIVAKREKVALENYNEELRARLGIVESNDGKTYGEFKILSYPRRKNDKVYTLYFDFEKYKDRFKEDRESWSIPIAELALDTTTNNFKGVYNAVYILIDIYSLFFIDEELATILLNNIIGWYLLSLRSISVDELKKSYNDEIDNMLTVLSKRDYKSEIKIFESELESLYSERENYKRRMKRYERNLQELELKEIEFNDKICKLMDASNSTTNIDENIKFQLEEILKLKDVKKVEFDEDKKYLYIYTNMIYIQMGSFRYRIGEFKIRLHYLDEGKINRGFNIEPPKFENLTPGGRRRSYWGLKCCHPHVAENGQPCLGNADAIYDCLRQRDIFGATVLAVEYLKSVNTSDSAGRYITSWDIVDENDNIIQLGYKYDNPPENMKVYTCEKCGMEAVVMSNEIKEYTFHNGKTAMLCSNCIAHEPHFCPTCDSIFLAKKEDGRDNKDMKHCSECGEYFCDDYCFGKDFASDSEEQKYCSENNVCIKCARKELERIKEEERQRRMKIFETIDEMLKVNEKTLQDFREMFHRRRSKSLEMNPIETEEKCPRCGKEWEQHYHCIDCGAPICIPDDEDSPRCDFCKKLESESALKDMIAKQYQVEEVMNGNYPVKIDEQTFRICPTCGETMLTSDENDECVFCRSVKELKKFFRSTRVYTHNFRFNRITR